MTPFSKTAFPTSKNLASEDKPVCQLLRNTSCKSEFAPIKRHTLNHFLCKSFLSLDPISAVSSVGVANVNANFSPLRSRAHVFKSHFFPLRVSILKAPAIFTVNAVSPPNVCNVVSRINPTQCLCEAPQYIHTDIVNNPANISYSRHESILCFLQPGTGFTRSSLTSSSPTLLSSKSFFLGRSPLSNIISCNSLQVSCSAKFSLFWIFLNVILLTQSTQNLLFFNFLTNFILLRLAFVKVYTNMSNFLTVYINQNEFLVMSFLNPL